VEFTVRRMLEMLQEAGDGVVRAWNAMAQAEPLLPLLAPWVLALAILVWLAALRSRRPQPLSLNAPQLLITQGEIAPEVASGQTITPRKRARNTHPALVRAGQLTMTISNLSRYPVQVLEVAVRQDSRAAPSVAHCERMIPALGSTEVEARLPLALEGDGWLDVYVYAAAPRHKLHRHRAELVWEPWVSRFKVAPMDQSLAPARQLASEERDARTDMPTAVGAIAEPAYELPANEVFAETPAPVVSAETPAAETPAPAVSAETPPAELPAAAPAAPSPTEPPAAEAPADTPRKRQLEFPDDF
jgi:hypothetical protein